MDRQARASPATGRTLRGSRATGKRPKASPGTDELPLDSLDTGRLARAKPVTGIPRRAARLAGPGIPDTRVAVVRLAGLGLVGRVTRARLVIPGVAIRDTDSRPHPGLGRSRCGRWV
jgi:hypothetical protein